MNFLAPYHSATDNLQVSISAQQGNDFAKNVADDYNPIHDTNSKRFCVPGDLLFAVALSRYGLHQQMSFQFRELVKADSVLSYPQADNDVAKAKFDVSNDREKPVLGVQYSGGSSMNQDQIEQLIRQYVVFSGQNFPHILVPLMQQHNVMINPARPLVIYESMSIELDVLDYSDLIIELGDTSLDVQGKRGNAELKFTLSENGTQIGKGKKNLVLSGLREYQEQAVQEMCDLYSQSKQNGGM